MSSALMQELAAEASAEPAAAPPDALAQLAALAARVAEIDAQLAHLERSAKDLAAEKNRVLTRDMVDIMDSRQVPRFSHGGRTYSAETKYHASIPEKSREAAADWLDANDAGDLVDRVVTAAFPKEHQAEAEAAAALLRQRFQMATVTTKRTVPWARLTAWFREQMTGDRPEGAPEIPRALLGANTFRYVKVAED